MMNRRFVLEGDWLCMCDSIAMERDRVLIGKVHCGWGMHSVHRGDGKSEYIVNALGVLLGGIRGAIVGCFSRGMVLLCLLPHSFLCDCGQP